MTNPPSVRALITGNPVALAHAVVGDAWTQLILREAFYGVRRFNEWSDALHIPRTVLSGRLKRLVDNKLLESVVPEGRKRAEYRLTAMGVDLFGIALMQGRWERDYAPSPMQSRYDMVFYDAASGERLDPVVLNGVGGATIDPYQVGWEAGPGLVEREAPAQRRWRSKPPPIDRPMIDRSVKIIGDYWSWLVVGCAFFRLRRFEEILSAAGMAPNILSDRLSRLVAGGVLERHAYQSGPERFEYRLTQSGRGLYPVVLATHGWSLRWLCDAADPPLSLIDRKTGERLHPVVCDSRTKMPIAAKATRWVMQNPASARRALPDAD
ncbi:winged helix-turn-helix transcriptional regulator [Pelagerythrobacter marinus]|uniref:winged helix-turn-helix transcriptional regulator n=1 Tax=Pelagerythrobacter marinus TaxID=538382 RepID=UPI002036A9C5|nr:helix-turn-helix domain-containing protein [Pelagerythrobacter marinus]USA39446.1 helix-turn-helix transcriptional regulator [Pelagerythrobacter marinus]WPZ06414.1 helix-turn-helix domain-containing protein [Pelagerythrobacter marinus]